MAKYHINPETGRAGQCSAKIKCRFGLAEDKHFSSKEEAREAYASGMASQTVQEAVKKKTSSYRLPERWDELPEQPTKSQVREAIRFAKENRKTVPVSYQEIGTSGDDWRPTVDYVHGEENPEPWGSGNRRVFALPSGEIVSVETTVSLEYYDDGGYYNYHPRFSRDVRLFRRPTDDYFGKGDFDVYAGGRQFYVEQNTEDSVLREETYGGSRLSYDHYDPNSAISAAKRLLPVADREIHSAVRFGRLSMSQKRISEDTLRSEQFLKSNDVRIRKALAGTKYLPKSLHEDLAADPDPEVRCELAKREDVSAKTLRSIIAGDPETPRTNYTPRVVAMSNPALPESAAKKILKGVNIHEIRAIAYNTGISEETRSAARDKIKEMGSLV